MYFVRIPFVAGSSNSWDLAGLLGEGEEEARVVQVTRGE